MMVVYSHEALYTREKVSNKVEQNHTSSII
jgi:hypothetical protein